MRKRGEGLAINTIIIAAIALVVLVVILAIYTNFIGKSSKSIDQPSEAAGKEASDAAWCISEMVKGRTCEEKDDCAGCSSAGGKTIGGQCQIVCANEGERHAINKKSNDRTYNCGQGEAMGSDRADRYCCCT